MANSVDESDISKVTEEVLRSTIQNLTPEQKTLLQNPPSRTMHYTEFEEMDPNENLGTEFNYFVRNVGDLLRQGHEGKYVLIKGTEIVGVYDSWSLAQDEGYARFPNQPIFIHRILERQPILRVRGLNF